MYDNMPVLIWQGLLYNFCMVVAEFLKVSLKQFTEDTQKLLNIEDEDAIRKAYDTIALPKRATVSSAGYDFVTPFSIDLRPNETIKIPTGIRCKMLDGYVLNIYPRSSFGMKYQMTLLNTVGIIDADYYGAKNEGHIIVAIENRSDKVMHIDALDRFVQGVFLAFYTAKEEEVVEIRQGGFGSSDKRP